MKRSLLVISITACLLISFGCGGGGGSATTQPNPGNIIRTDTLAVPPNQGASQTFGADSFIVDAGAFPNGSTLVSTQYDPVNFASPPANKTLGIYNVTNLTSSAENMLPIKVSVAGGGDTKRIVAYRDSNNPNIWHWDSSVASNDALSFQLTSGDNSRALQQRGLQNAWNWLVARIQDDLPDTDSDTPILIANSNTAGKTIAVAHGILDNVGSITKLAEYLHRGFGASRTYALPYNYREDTPTVGPMISQQLYAMNAPDKSVMLFLHSRGGLVGRETIEHLMVPKAISDCVVMCSPNTGAYAVDQLQSLKQDWDDFLNDPFSISPTPAYEQEGCVTEMVPGSSFLRQLNVSDLYNGYNQRVAVNYYFIAAGNDTRVPLESALATNVPMEEITSGSIERHVMTDAKHGDIKTSPSRMAEVVSFVKSHSDAAIGISLVNSYVDAGDYGWDYTIRLTNNTGSSLPVHDLTINEYDGLGNPLGTYWVNPGLPSDQYFPTHFYRLDETMGLAPGQMTSISVHTWLNANRDPIWLFSPQYQCGTDIITVRATVDGEHQAVQHVILTRHYGSIVPTNGPQTFVRSMQKVGTPVQAVTSIRRN